MTDTLSSQSEKKPVRSQQRTGFQNLPVLGVGLGLRKPMAEETLKASERLDWLEIVPENFMRKGGYVADVLERALGSFPVTTHGVNLSLCSSDGWDEDYLDALKELLDDIQAPWFSDHLCLTRIGTSYINDLIPSLRTKATLQNVVDRIHYLQDRIQRPFIFENVSYYMELPGNEIPEADFIAELAERADTGILLDVNNVFVNSQNLGGDPYDVLKKMPLERVVQIHMAGHSQFEDGLLDTHGAPVADPVWEIFDWVLQRSKPCAVMIERDNHFPPFEELLSEIEQMRQIWDKTQGPMTRDSSLAHEGLINAL